MVQCVHQKLCSRWSPWRNHVCQVSKWNFQGSPFYRGRIFYFPIDMWMGLTTVRRYCAACDHKIDDAAECGQLGIPNLDDYFQTRFATLNSKRQVSDVYGMYKWENCLKCIYTVSQKTSHLWLAITLTHMNGFRYFFGRNVTNKVGNQKTLYYATSNNLCFCTTWQNAKTQKSHFTQLDCVTHTMHLCAIFLKEKNCHLWCVW